MIEFMILFLMFIFYSFIGYIIETVYCSIEQKKIMNRGFLVGPWLPIYGIAGVLLPFLLNSYQDDPVVVFIFGVLITSGIEYFTGYILEKIFHNKWWEYSHRKDSINGRICLGNSLMFGIGALIAVCYFNPMLEEFILGINLIITIILFSIIFVVFVADVIYSVIIAHEFRNQLIIVEKFKKEKMSMIIKKLEERFKLKPHKSRLNTKRLIKAFPNLRKIKELNILKDFRKTKKDKDKL